MKISIKHKLFILILCCNLILTVFMLILNNQSFSNGFEQYVKETEKTKLQPLIDDIGKTYQQQGDWLWLRRNRRLWHELLREHLGGRRPHPLPAHMRHPGMPPPPRIPHKLPPMQLELMFFNTHFYIMDIHRQVVLGGAKKIELFRWLPITVDEELVGYFGYINNDKTKRQLDALFVKQQQKDFISIAFAVIVISVLIAILAATHFLRPLHKVNMLLKRITEGDYQQRLAINSQDEIATLSLNLNHLAETLQKNLHIRQQWFAAISHELLTPLTILQGEIEAVQDGVRIMDSARLNSIYAEVERLNHLVNDLHQLTLTDKAALSYSMQPVDIIVLLKQRLAYYQQALPQSGLQCHLKIPQTPTILALDEIRIKQLLDNLMQNSRRYTDSPGIIDVSLTIQGAQIVLLWEDSSPGVTDVDLQNLLQPLYRAEGSRNRISGGSGLGLAICQNIVSAHRGEMRLAHSALGGLQVLMRFIRN